jgi:hypothetical protein
LTANRCCLGVFALFRFVAAANQSVHFFCKQIISEQIVCSSSLNDFIVKVGGVVVRRVGSKQIAPSACSISCSPLILDTPTCIFAALLAPKSFNVFAKPCRYSVCVCAARGRTHGHNVPPQFTFAFSVTPSMMIICLLFACLFNVCECVCSRVRVTECRLHDDGVVGCVCGVTARTHIHTHSVLIEVDASETCTRGARPHTLTIKASSAEQTRVHISSMLVLLAARMLLLLAGTVCDTITCTLCMCPGYLSTSGLFAPTTITPPLFLSSPTHSSLCVI